MACLCYYKYGGLSQNQKMCHHIPRSYDKSETSQVLNHDKLLKIYKTSYFKSLTSNSDVHRFNEQPPTIHFKKTYSTYLIKHTRREGGWMYNPDHNCIIVLLVHCENTFPSFRVKQWHVMLVNSTRRFVSKVNVKLWLLRVHILT